MDGSPIREFEHKHKCKMQEIIRHDLTDEQFRELCYAAIDWSDEEENGSAEWREERRQAYVKRNAYIAYLLRNDLDRVFYAHPYPSPISDRLKRVWPLASHLYFEDDPSGFLGPSAGEIVYVMQAIQISALLGNHDFDDVLSRIAHDGYAWFAFDSDVPDDPDFEAWLKTDDYFHMFENRERHPDLDYTRLWTDDPDDKAYVAAFFLNWSAQFPRGEVEPQD